MIPIIFILLFSSAWSRSLNWRQCNQSELRCDNGQCIDRLKWCNNRYDCRDKTDEKYCNGNQKQCNSSEFRCDDGQCIAKEQWCNDEDDCEDGTDEYYCDGVLECMDIYFTCGDGQCIPLSGRCDNFADCPDDSDEIDCIDYGDSEESIKNDSSESTSATESSEITPASSYEAIQSSRIPKMSTNDVNHYKTPKTFQILKVPASTASDYEDERTSVAPETLNNIESTGTPTAEQNNYQKLADVMINIVLDYGSQRINENNGQTSYDRQFPFFKLVSDRASSFTFYAPHGPHTRLPDTHGRVAEKTHVFRIYPSTTIIDYDSFRNQRQLSKEHESYIVQIRRPFHSSGQYPFPFKAGSHAEHKLYPSVTQTTTEASKSILPPFYFQNDYTRKLGNRYADVVQRAKRWLMERIYADKMGEDTARSLTALSLLTNSFLNSTENDSMSRKLTTLADKSLQLNSLWRIEPSKLALYINAFLATCQDPKLFRNKDLTNMLLKHKERGTTVDPMVYLALCLTDTVDDLSYLPLLKNFIVDSGNEDKSLIDEEIMTTIALACFKQQDVHNFWLTDKLQEDTSELLRKRRDDGSFGSIRTTALAAQALISMNTSSSWNPKLTLDYLAKQQLKDGSFGDMLTTYYILPVLSGRSLLHLRNTRCGQAPNRNLPVQDTLNAPGANTSIYYTLKVGCPETSSVSTFLSIPSGTHFFDAMKIAELSNPRFRILYELNNEDLAIHTVSGIPNNPQLGYRWHLYVIPGSIPRDFLLNLQSEAYHGNLHELIPRESDELLFWYLKL